MLFWKYSHETQTSSWFLPFQEIYPHTYFPDFYVTSFPIFFSFQVFDHLAKPLATVHESVHHLTSGHFFFKSKFPTKCTAQSSTQWEDFFLHCYPSRMSHREAIALHLSTFEGCKTSANSVPVLRPRLWSTDPWLQRLVQKWTCYWGNFTLWLPEVYLRRQGKKLAFNKKFLVQRSWELADSQLGSMGWCWKAKWIRGKKEGLVGIHASGSGSKLSLEHTDSLIVQAQLGLSCFSLCKRNIA